MFTEYRETILYNYMNLMFVMGERQKLHFAKRDIIIVRIQLQKLC